MRNDETPKLKVSKNQKKKKKGYVLQTGYKSQVPTASSLLGFN